MKVNLTMLAGEDGSDQKRLRMNVLDSLYGTVRSASAIAFAGAAILAKNPSLQVSVLIDNLTF